MAVSAQAHALLAEAPRVVALQEVRVGTLDRWLSTLEAAVQGELDRVSQTLTGRLSELAERYTTSLPILNIELSVLAARVDEHPSLPHAAGPGRLRTRRRPGRDRAYGMRVGPAFDRLVLISLGDDSWLGEVGVRRLGAAAAAAHDRNERLSLYAGGDGQATALRAVELAYLERGVSHERAAERMLVSRSTFYRLLRRGTQALARELAGR